MIVDLIKALIEPAKPLLVDEGFYKTSLEDIERDGISSQIYFLLKQKEMLEQTPIFFQKNLRENYEKNLYQNLFIKSQMNQILKLFEEEKVEVIPIKGVTFAESYFNHIGARPTSDIDLLIRKTDLLKATLLVKDLGFSIEEKKIPGHFHVSLSKQLPGTFIPLTVELHWDILKEKTANFKINEFWNHATPKGQALYIKELSHYHTFYMICLHGWRHNLDSLKYFLDIIQMIDVLQNELDFELLLRNAASHKTFNRMVRTLTIVYQLFPYLDKIKEFPFKRKKNYWAYHTSKGIKRYLDFLDYQLFSFDTIMHSLIEAPQWIFPNWQGAASSQKITNQNKSIFPD